MRELCCTNPLKGGEGNGPGQPQAQLGDAIVPVSASDAIVPAPAVSDAVVPTVQGFQSDGSLAIAPRPLIHAIGGLADAEEQYCHPENSKPLTLKTYKEAFDQWDKSVAFDLRHPMIHDRDRRRDKVHRHAKCFKDEYCGFAKSRGVIPQKMSFPVICDGVCSAKSASSVRVLFAKVKDFINNAVKAHTDVRDMKLLVTLDIRREQQEPVNYMFVAVRPIGAQTAGLRKDSVGWLEMEQIEDPLHADKPLVKIAKYPFVHVERESVFTRGVTQGIPKAFITTELIGYSLRPHCQAIKEVAVFSSELDWNHNYCSYDPEVAHACKNYSQSVFDAAPVAASAASGDIDWSESAPSRRQRKRRAAPSGHRVGRLRTRADIVCPGPGDPLQGVLMEEPESEHPDSELDQVLEDLINEDAADEDRT